MEGDQFSLSWNNFHTNLSTGFNSLLKNEDLVDVTLAAGGKFTKAHKTVLSVCSPFFKELFRANPNKHPIVILPDVSYNALCNLLQFMYQGEVRITQEEIPGFMRVAELLKVQGLGDYNSTSSNQTFNPNVEGINCNEREYPNVETKQEPIDDDDNDEDETMKYEENNTAWNFESGESSQAHSRPNNESNQELSIPADETVNISACREDSKPDSYLTLEKILNDSPQSTNVSSRECFGIESDYPLQDFKFNCDHDGKEVIEDVNKRKRSRWNKRDPSKWKRNAHKIQRIKSKIPRPVNCDNCRYTCTSHFSEEMRISFCNFFWRCDYIRQKDFILRNTESLPPARRRCRTEGRTKLRKDAKFYYFHMGPKRVRVCKDYFIKTLCISSHVVETAYKGKGESGMFIGNDGRGGHRQNKFQLEKIQY